MDGLVTRRELMRLVQGGAATAAFGGCAILTGGASHPVIAPDQVSLREDELRIPTTALAAVAPATVVEVKPGGGRPDLLLLAPKAGGEWRVVTAHCTHRGCVVGWDQAVLEWRCPCHGSRFGPDGHLIAGPASRPLAAPPARLEGDALVVSLGGLTA